MRVSPRSLNEFPPQVSLIDSLIRSDRRACSSVPRGGHFGPVRIQQMAFVYINPAGTRISVKRSKSFWESEVDVELWNTGG